MKKFNKPEFKTELDNLMPWEKEVYVNLLKNFIKEENEKRRREAMKK